MEVTRVWTSYPHPHTHTHTVAVLSEVNTLLSGKKIKVQRNTVELQNINAEWNPDGSNPQGLFLSRNTLKTTTTKSFGNFNLHSFRVVFHPSLKLKAKKRQHNGLFIILSNFLGAVVMAAGDLQ